MVEDAAGLGPVLEVHGRDESEGRQWGQAVLLGGLLALFLAPGLGFPILSGGPRYGAFALATAGLALVLTLAVKALRRNRAVRIHAEGLTMVDGRTQHPLRFDAIRRGRYDPLSRRLALERREGPTVRLRVPPGVGQAALDALRAWVEKDAESPPAR